MEDISKKHLDTICKIFASFEGEDDMRELLLDVCTHKELESIYQRFKVAQMLKNGYTFVQIENKTGISSTTITRVSKCLKRGTGYNKMFYKYHQSIDLKE